MDINNIGGIFFLFFKSPCNIGFSSIALALGKLEQTNLQNLTWIKIDRILDVVFTLLFAETLDPEVKFLSVAIVSPERPDLVLSIPEDGKPPGLWFTLKEGSHYRLKFTFQVSNNIVSGLRYTNTVWKSGLRGKPLITCPNSCKTNLKLQKHFKMNLVFQFSAQRIWLEPLVLNKSHIHMKCQKRLPLLVLWLKDHILQSQRFVQLSYTYVCIYHVWFLLTKLLFISSLMMITSATWRSTIHLTSVKTGLQLTKGTTWWWGEWMDGWMFWWRYIFSYYLYIYIYISFRPVLF